MKKLLLLFCATFILIPACKKRAPEPKPVPVPPADQINYKSFESPEEVFSVREYSVFNVNCYMRLPYPADSATFYDIDMDGDQVFDFKFVASHERDSSGVFCGHCYDQTNFRVFIKGLHADNFIAQGTSSPKAFSENERIDLQNKWQPNLPISGRVSCYTIGGFSEGYIGVSMGKRVGYIRLENLDKNGVRIFEYALNKTEGNSIVCGQKK